MPFLQPLMPCLLGTRKEVEGAEAIPLYQWHPWELQWGGCYCSPPAINVALVILVAWLAAALYPQVLLPMCLAAAAVAEQCRLFYGTARARWLGCLSLGVVRSHSSSGILS